MDKVMNKKLAQVAAVAAVALVSSGAAMAQVDVSAVVSGIDEAKIAIVTVGGALISLAVVVMTYRWIKGFVAGG